MNEILSVSLRRIVPSANMFRQYTVTVGRDLFGLPMVTCRWGRIGQPGQVRQHVCDTVEEAQALAAKVIEKRRRRGYQEVPHERSVAVAPGAALAAPAAGGPRHQRQRREARSSEQGMQLLLFLPGNKPLQAQHFEVPSNAPAPHPATTTNGVPLMRRLGKPATQAERERALSLLTMAASLRGLTLSRGSNVLLPA